MYKKKSKGWLKHADFIILDLICIELSLLIAYWIRHGLSNPYAVPIYRNAALILVFLHILVVFFTESYKSILRRGLYQEFLAVVKYILEIVLLLSFVLYIIGTGETYSRTTTILTGILGVGFCYFARVLWKNHLTGRGNLGKRKVLIVSTEMWIRRVLRIIANYNYEGLDVIGIAIMDADLRGQKILNKDVVCSKDDVLEYIKSNWIDDVLVSVPREVNYSREFEDFMENCDRMGVTIHQTLGNVESHFSRNQFVERIAGFDVLTTTTRLVTSRQMFFKRTLDICGGLVGCLLTGILFLFIAPAIYLKSPGPIFFTQIRVGRNGKPFKLYKFRSMYLDAEERKKELMAQNENEDDLMFKIEDDPRIIKGVGHFIRKYSLDEFPQFFNVLKGDMSLVGTRPPTVDEWERYDLHHRKRLVIKPGLTGLWQVSGRSNIKDFEEVVALDTKYINEWNFGMDIKIILKTIKVVLTNEGAV